MLKTAENLAPALTSVLSMNMTNIEGNFTNTNTHAIASQSQKVDSLQFYNYIGSEVTPEISSAFIKITNDAYIFYRDSHYTGKFSFDFPRK